MEAIVYISFYLFTFFSSFFFSDVDSMEKRKVYASKIVLRIKIHLGGNLYIHLTEFLITTSANIITIEPKWSVGSMSYLGLIPAKKNNVLNKAHAAYQHTTIMPNSPPISPQSRDREARIYIDWCIEKTVLFTCLASTLYRTCNLPLSFRSLQNKKV